MQLSEGAEHMAQLLLKHYPMQEGVELGDKMHSKQSGPQQHLHDYRKQREIFDKPTAQKLQNMQFFKEEGNNHYKNGRYSEATYFYQKIIIYADYTFPDNQPETAKMDTILQQANCNLALSMIKLNKWQQARNNLIEATKGRGASVKAKAHYWLAKLYLREGVIDQAKKQIDLIKQMGNEHIKYVQQLESQAEEIGRRQQNAEKETFKSMFK